MPSPSKNKGSSFEREVAKFLSDLYSESFIRAPGSGAYVGGKNQARKQYLHEGQIRSFKGDIVPGQSFTKFNAECKNYGEFPFHQLFTGECKTLDSWIEQMMDVAEDGDMMRMPGLIELGERDNVPVTTIKAMQEYLAKHPLPERDTAELDAHRVAFEVETTVPTEFGSLKMRGYRDRTTGTVQIEGAQRGRIRGDLAISGPLAGMFSMPESSRPK